MFSLGRKPDPERNLHALLDQAFAELDPLRFHDSIDGVIACRPMVQALNRLAGSSDRFAPVNLRSTCARTGATAAKHDHRDPRKGICDPVVVAVVAGALRYVRHKDTNSEIDKKIRRLVARLNLNGRR